MLLSVEKYVGWKFEREINVLHSRKKLGMLTIMTIIFYINDTHKMQMFKI